MRVTLFPSAQIASWNAQVIPEASTYRRRWSWAAFLNPVLWPLTHGYAMLSLTEFASLLVVRFARPSLWTSLLWLGILLTRFALGVAGNRLALNGRRFESTDDFVDCEKAWQYVGTILFAIGIAILIVGAGLRAALRSF